MDGLSVLVWSCAVVRCDGWSCCGGRDDAYRRVVVVSWCVVMVMVVVVCRCVVDVAVSYGGRDGKMVVCWYCGRGRWMVVCWC